MCWSRRPGRVLTLTLTVVLLARSAAAQEPELLAAYAPMGLYYGLELVGDTVYMAGYDFYHTVDVSDPAQPTGQVTNSGSTITTIEVADNCVYSTADTFPTLSARTIPPGPSCFASWDLPGSGSGGGVTVSGGLAFLLTGSLGMRILDVSNLPTIVEIGSFDPVGAALSDVSVFGTHAYATGGTAGLFILDVSDPTMPMHVDTIAGSDVSSVEIAGSRLYVGGDELRIFDVSNPTAPVLIGELPTPDRITHVDEADGLLYSTSQVTSRVIDISNPAQPFIVAEVVIPSLFGNFGADGEGDILYVSNLITGLHIFRISRPPPPPTQLPIQLPGLAAAILISGWLARRASCRR